VPLPVPMSVLPPVLKPVKVRPRFGWVKPRFVFTVDA